MRRISPGSAALGAQVRRPAPLTAMRALALGLLERVATTSRTKAFDFVQQGLGAVADAAAFQQRGSFRAMRMRRLGG